MGATELRRKLVELMNQTVLDQHRWRNWHYAAIRPQNIPSTYHAPQQVYVDCSDGCRMLCRVVGVYDDPAGNRYAPYGNSSSIWAHLHHISFDEVQPGDIFTFGYYAGEHHACMAYKKTNGQWQVWNMGGPGQPVIDWLSQEIAYHRGMTVTACRLNLPPDPPPPPKKWFQKMTGFYSWLAWRLGEGPWKKYGKHNPKVRPNVPKVIPASWWVKNARFLANRKRADKPTHK